jgi:hypothetical protein
MKLDGTGLSVDAAELGNEGRFVNDYRGVPGALRVRSGLAVSFAASCTQPVRRVRHLRAYKSVASRTGLRF